MEIVTTNVIASWPPEQQLAGEYHGTQFCCRFCPWLFCCSHTRSFISGPLSGPVSTWASPLSSISWLFTRQPFMTRSNSLCGLSLKRILFIQLIFKPVRSRCLNSIAYKLRTYIGLSTATLNFLFYFYCFGFASYMGSRCTCFLVMWATLWIRNSFTYTLTNLLILGNFQRTMLPFGLVWSIGCDKLLKSQNLNFGIWNQVVLSIIKKTIKLEI